MKKKRSNKRRKNKNCINKKQNLNYINPVSFRKGVFIFFVYKGKTQDLKSSNLAYEA